MNVSDLQQNAQNQALNHFFCSKQSNLIFPVKKDTLFTCTPLLKRNMCELHEVKHSGSS